MKSKKYLIVLVLKILESFTDSSHKLTQIEIAKQISKVYPCDRKTVGRNIKFLQKIGYPIVKTGTGFYMDNKFFSVYEIDYVIRAIDSAEDSDIINKAELKEKIKKQINSLKRK